MAKTTTNGNSDASAASAAPAPVPAKIMTSEAYINSIAERANSVSDAINDNTLRQSRFNDQQNIYQDQLKQVDAVLAYVEKLDPQIQSLTTSISALLAFFEVSPTATLTPAQTDLPPADTTLSSVYAMASQVAARVYQSIMNVNVCAVAMEDTYNALIKGTKYDPAQPPGDSFGHLPVESGPQNDLVSKFKSSRDAGIAAMEKLANTFLEYINFLQILQELRGFSQYLGDGYVAEIAALDTLDSRVENREKIAKDNQTELQADYDTAHANYVAVTDLLNALKLDYDLLKTEYTAAVASSKPGTSITSLKPAAGK